MTRLTPCFLLCCSVLTGCTLTYEEKAQIRQETIAIVAEMETEKLEKKVAKGCQHIRGHKPEVACAVRNGVYMATLKHRREADVLDASDEELEKFANLNCGALSDVGKRNICNARERVALVEREQRRAKNLTSDELTKIYKESSCVNLEGHRERVICFTKQGRAKFELERRGINPWYSSSHLD